MALAHYQMCLAGRDQQIEHYRQFFIARCGVDIAVKKGYTRSEAVAVDALLGHEPELAGVMVALL